MLKTLDFLHASFFFAFGFLLTVGRICVRGRRAVKMGVRVFWSAYFNGDARRTLGRLASGTLSRCGLSEVLRALDNSFSCINSHKGIIISIVIISIISRSIILIAPLLSYLDYPTGTRYLLSSIIKVSHYAIDVSIFIFLVIAYLFRYLCI